MKTLRETFVGQEERDPCVDEEAENKAHSTHLFLAHETGHWPRACKCKTGSRGRCLKGKRQRWQSLTLTSLNLWRHSSLPCFWFGVRGSQLGSRVSTHTHTHLHITHTLTCGYTCGIPIDTVRKLCHYPWVGRDLASTQSLEQGSHGVIAGQIMP